MSCQNLVGLGTGDRLSLTTTLRLRQPPFHDFSPWRYIRGRDLFASICGSHLMHFYILEAKPNISTCDQYNIEVEALNQTTINHFIRALEEEI